MMRVSQHLCSCNGAEAEVVVTVVDESVTAEGDDCDAEETLVEESFNV
jgi:hypothetical protein